MKRIAVIGLVSYLGLALEFVLYNAFGAWGKPELMLLVVVFFNLYLGIRFSIIAAVFCGILKDTCGIAPPGTYLLVYIIAAFMTTLVRRYLYEQGSKFSRALVAFFVVIACFMTQVLLAAINHEVRFNEVFVDIFIPQLLTTMLAATYVFQQLKSISVFFALKS